MNHATISRVSSLTPILLLALAHGLLYVFLVPPWQHYDEPGHFEYAWLSAHRVLIPTLADTDKEMRRNVARSMLEHGFYRGLGYVPDLQSDSLLDIGFTMLNYHPPLYYVLAGLPLRAFPEEDVTAQLYAARLVSLLLFLSTIVAAYGSIRLLTPEGHALRWLVPTAMAMLPGYVDIMTSVNNDVGATAAFSFFLWACISLMRASQSVTTRSATVLWLLVAIALCYYTKKTVALALPLAALALLFGTVQGRWRWIAWSALATSLVALVLLTFGLGDASFWYRHTSQAAATRCAGTECQSPIPVGEYAIQLKAEPGGELPELAQPLLVAHYSNLAGQTVTIGAWMWATRPTSVLMPRFFGGREFPAPMVAISAAPQFVAYTTQLPNEMVQPRITLAPLLRPPDQPVTIYYDGLVLASGARVTDDAPRFADTSAQSGEWAGAPFQNWIRNGSAEQSWPFVRSWLSRFDDVVWGGKATDTFSSLLDTQAMSWYYQATSTTLFETFWARFGWGHVPLPDVVYALLALITLVGVMAGVVALAAHARSLPYDALAVLGCAAILVWLLAFLRGASQSLWLTYYIPVARYAEPAIIPTMILLSVGWLAIVNIARRFTAVAWHLFVSLWLIFDLFALSTLVRFYLQ